jgi:hypothetical protein
MKRVVGTAFFVLSVFVCPAASRAALYLTIEPAFSGVPGTRFLDLVFHESGTPQDERLAIYDVELRLVPSGNSGIELVTGPGAVQLGPNPVFDTGSTTVTLVESTPTRLLADFDGSVPTDIEDGETAARILYTVAPNACGAWRFLLDDRNTVFADADANAIPVDLSSTTIVIFCPEPGTLSLLPVVGVLALRRRRSA